MRRFVERVLALTGLELGSCRGAVNGVDALEKLKDFRPDLVLTDINMPEMDGETLIQNISADDELSGIPVVVVSTDKTQERMKRVFALGAKGYVSKPFYPETLREELERVLEPST
jgi:two-component system chemotaxis response regulator CheY